MGKKTTEKDLQPGKKRGFLQFHISAAVVGMFMAGAMISLNLNVRRIPVEEPWWSPKNVKEEVCGWPVTAYRMGYHNLQPNINEYHRSFFTARVYWIYAILDLVVGVALTLGAVMITEFIVRKLPVK